MAQTATRLISGSIMTSSTLTYYTAPSGAKTVIKKLVIVNTTAASINATIYLVPGGSAGTSNTITAARVIAAAESWSCPEAENMVLETSGTIQALGSGLTILSSGIEIT